MTILKIQRSFLSSLGEHIVYTGTGVPGGQITPSVDNLGARWIRTDPPVGGPSQYIVVFNSPNYEWEAVA